MCEALLYLPDDQATTRAGALLAPVLQAGDCLLLSGGLGAGKTHLARAIIQTILEDAGRNEDVPSPTYTLVQTYSDGGREIWHADLYRLSEPDELIELGLDEAFGTAICLVEWPERLGARAPVGALRINLQEGPGGDGRILRVTGDGPLRPPIAKALARLAALYPVQSGG